MKNQENVAQTLPTSTPASASQKTPSVMQKSLSVAPMMAWTDRHERYLLRLISPRTRLYTEMVTTGALVYGDHRQRLLAFDASEHPVVLQLGGNEAADLAGCARMAEREGYDEVNMNVGCPSDRVQSGRFGACLMLEPQRVADCVRAMLDAVTIPITVKCRIGVDEQEDYESFAAFAQTIQDAGCETVIVHARKAWLSGLSPKQNRDIPPLRYDYVYRLKQDLPDLKIIINGGITDPISVAEHLAGCDGVMIGRAAYQTPMLLAEFEHAVFGNDANTLTDPFVVLERYMAYVETQLSQDVYLKNMARHALGLFHARPGAKSWRRYLSENMCKPGAGVEVFQRAVEFLYPAEIAA